MEKILNVMTTKILVRNQCFGAQADDAFSESCLQLVIFSRRRTGRG